MPQPGELYHYPEYIFPDGDRSDKFVVLMGMTRAEDWILARTTSRPSGRPTNPPCYHGNPYAGFWLDTANGLFKKPTWLALNRLDDHDALNFKTKLTNSRIKLVGTLAKPQFCGALRCAANAQDTTKEQERAMRDLLAKLRCP